MVIVVLLEWPFGWYLGAVVHRRIDGSTQVVLWSLSSGRSRCFRLDHFAARDWRKCFLLQHGVGEITAGLRSYCWWRGASFLRFLHLQSSLLTSLPSSRLLGIGHSCNTLAFSLHLALTFCFLPALLLLFPLLFFFDSSTLALDFLLSLAFSLGSKLILERSVGLS